MTFNSKLLRILLVFSFCFFYSANQHVFAQQQAQYTQFMNNELTLNPSYAGMDEVLNISFGYRNQWTGLEGAPSTQTFTAHSIMGKRRIGVGTVIVSDKIGSRNLLSFKGNFAYRFKLNRKTILSLGISMGLARNDLGYTGLLSQIKIENDPLITQTQTSFTNFIAGSGLFIKGSKVRFSLSSPNMIGPKSINDKSLTLIPQLFTFSSYTFTLNANLDIVPAVFVKYFEGAPLSYDFFSSFIFNKVIHFGIGYRSSGSLIFLTKLKLTPQLLFTYSFDKALTNVTSLSSASHEIMIAYQFKFAKYNAGTSR